MPVGEDPRRDRGGRRRPRRDPCPAATRADAVPTGEERASWCDVALPGDGRLGGRGHGARVAQVASATPVAVDDPLVEISTDKVDAELPSPVAGTVAEILVEPDATVAVGTRAVPHRGRRRRAAPATARRGAPRRARRGARPPPATAPRTPPPSPSRMASAHGIDLGVGQGQRPARAGDQGGRAGRAGRRRRTAAPPPPERRRDRPDPRPRGHARPLHGREPLDPHRHQLPHAPGGRARRPPARAQGRRPASSPSPT